jgi:16S rRNA (cytosine1402-N4)-methyltransferase
MSHTPVLLKEVLEYLDPQPGNFILDGTVDGGNHAAAIIEKIMPGGKLLGLDWDAQLLAECQKRFRSEKNVILLRGNYGDAAEILKKHDLSPADGLLIDLGFSSEQLAKSGRGFSFAESAKDEPLLMTYSDTQTPVAQILRELDETALADIIYTFGGERMSRRIAKAIKERGRRRPIVTVGDLTETIHEALPKHYERGRIDPATRTFQALRIYANEELKNLKKILDSLDEVVKPGGRVVVISFHSLEDRIVKQAFQEIVKAGGGRLLTKKPIPASRDEIKENPRSRSAKLRAIQIAV